MTEKRRPDGPQEFSSAEISALSHLYRGDVYRSTVWRSRLDTTTNWAVVTLGVALSVTFASPEASPVPLILVGVLILFFLALEARRYRYFNVWSARSRWMEQHFFAPMLQDGDLHTEENWQQVLATDYLRPVYHISFATALARRIKRNYLWILLIQLMAYLGKLTIHPIGASSWQIFVGRADIGPIPGEIVLLTGLIYISVFFAAAVWSTREDERRRESRTAAADALG